MAIPNSGVSMATRKMLAINCLRRKREMRLNFILLLKYSKRRLPSQMAKTKIRMIPQKIGFGMGKESTASPCVNFMFKKE